jgi:two-component system, response regulator / RNA-binding antiterminator
LNAKACARFLRHWFACSTHQPAKVRILLVHETEHDIERLLDVLLRDGDTVRSVVANSLTLMHEIEAWHPELLMIAADDPSRDMVEQICVASMGRDRPIVMFTEADDPLATRSLVKAGVSAYVVAGLKPERLRSVINVAIERFEHEREQHVSLREAQRRAEDERAVARAKNYLRRQGLDEADAYAELRTRAMRSRCSIAEVARRIVGAPGV